MLNEVNRDRKVNRDLINEGRQSYNIFVTNVTQKLDSIEKRVQFQAYYDDS